MPRARTANAATKFAEQLGVLLGSEGYPRVAGRLLGSLILAPDPVSLDDLARQLGVSKASVSVNVRMLEHKGVVERVGTPGDRRDYYRVAPDLLARSIEQRIARWQRFHDAVHECRMADGAQPKAVRARLLELDRAYAYVIAQMSGALKTLRKQGSPTGPSAAS